MVNLLIHSNKYDLHEEVGSTEVGSIEVEAALGQAEEWVGQ